MGRNEIRSAGPCGAEQRVLTAQERVSAGGIFGRRPPPALSLPVGMVPLNLKTFSRMFQLFYEGGWLGMSILTVELIGLLFAAWKAPAWVKEIGLLALISGFIYTLFGFSQAMHAIQLAGDISPSLFAGGVRASSIPILYGLMIYVVSLLIRMFQKPRI